MTLFENAYNEVAAIVREFEEHREMFMAHKYQESEVRTDFIDKFFTALGWDVAHREQTNPREREVKIEKSDTAGSTRRVDYAFYLKPDYRNPVYFCEAKKPSRDLNNADDYFQLVRYGYGASTPVGVLTNFDEFHIIDCRYQPHIEKSYPSAQIKVYGYKDYLDKDAFGFIYWLFSREAIQAGKLKEYASGLPKQRGTGKTKLTAEEAKPVDEAFLIKLEEYRRILAKAFKKADESLTAEVLTEATQKVIDRLVFIRFLEDKYIEADYIVDQIAATNHPLTPALKRRGDENSPSFSRRGPGGGRTAWQKFIAWSKELDVKYNGIVFKPHDIDKPTFKAPDDKTFAELCADISHSHSKYLFTYIPIELLGSIYERFLGKVVTTTAKRADIEEKPEVRKAGGVYYTPKYIVDYIVANTVGRILNPLLSKEGAGGGPEGTAISSSIAHPQPPPVPRLEKAGEQDTPAFSRRGKGAVDPGGLTPKEISKLRFADIACGSGSFLIAVYDTVLHHVEKYYNDNPDEAKKAKCTEIEKGVFALSLRQKQQILLDNIYGVDIDRQAVEVAQLSLFLKLLESESGATAEQLSFERTKILPDLSKNIQCGNSLVEYDIEQLFPLTAAEFSHIKPFSFQQAFKPIMDSGGFDAIVGNPPYVIIAKDIFDEATIKYLLNYGTAEYKADLFQIFIERAIQLLKNDGKFGYIVPNPWLTQVFTQSLRKFILEQTEIDQLVIFKGLVFEEATVNTLLLFLNKHKPSIDHRVIVIDADLQPELGKRYDAPQDLWLKSEGYIIETRRMDEMGKLVDHILAKTVPLGSVVRASLGCQAYNSSKHTKKQIEDRVFHATEKLSKEYLPELAGNDVSRYRLERIRGQWIKYGSWLHDYRSMDWLEGPRILVREISGGQPYAMQATYTEDTYCNYKTILNINPLPGSDYPMKYLLGVLNSRLVSRIYPYVSNKIVSSTFPRLSVGDLRKIPLPVDAAKATQTKIANLVDQMLATKKQLAASQRDSEREQLQRKCDYLDGEIDKLVYALYGLTEEEIRIVDGE